MAPNVAYALNFVHGVHGPGYAPNACLSAGNRQDYLTSDKFFCYWCSAYERQDAYCTNEYADCVGATIMDVPVGMTLSMAGSTQWRCTPNGWEEYGGLPSSTGCYSGTGCTEYCYWDDGPYTCLSCPMPDFLVPQDVVPTTLRKGIKSDITDCKILPVSGVFQDETGVFELVDECSYSK